MPWYPDLFSARALARIWEDERRRRLAVVPFFPGLMTREINALIESFAGEPEVHHPIRGRVKGAAAFERFALRTNTWLADREAAVEDIEFVLTDARGVEELVLHLVGDSGRMELPVAIASDFDDRRRIVEQRVYFSTAALTGRHATRPPLLQPAPDAEAAVAALEAEGYALFSSESGIAVEHCAVTDDGRACALEYNVVGRGGTEMTG